MCKPVPSYAQCHVRLLLGLQSVWTCTQPTPDHRPRGNPPSFDAESDRRIAKINAVPGQVALSWEHHILPSRLSTLEAATGSVKMHFVQACVELLVRCAISFGKYLCILCLNHQTMLSYNQLYSLNNQLLLTVYKESGTLTPNCPIEELRRITAGGNMQGKKQIMHTIIVCLLSGLCL